MRRITCTIALSALLCLTVAADGVNRRPQRARSRPARRASPPAGTSSTHTTPPAPRPHVTTIDAAGLQQLLARGPAAQARPLLVNFWATWCEPCRTEFPDLVKLDAHYRARGLEFVVVSVDDPGELLTGVPKFLTEMRAQMPAYLLNVTDSEPVINALDPDWGGELPATFLFDRRGQIVFNHKGRVKPAELRAAIEQVLNN